MQGRYLERDGGEAAGDVSAAGDAGAQGEPRRAARSSGEGATREAETAQEAAARRTGETTAVPYPAYVCVVNSCSVNRSVL